MNLHVDYTQMAADGGLTDYSISASELALLARSMIGTRDPLGDSPGWRESVKKRRERDSIWLFVKELFQQAYICCLLDLEAIVGHYIERPVDVEAAIDFIEEARCFRPHGEGMPYDRPTWAEVREWRPRHTWSNTVYEARASNDVLGAPIDRERLLDVIGENRLWYRTWHEVSVALAKSVRSIDPDIYWGSQTEDLERAIRHVAQEQRLARFMPDLDCVSRNL